MEGGGTAPPPLDLPQVSWLRLGDLLQNSMTENITQEIYMMLCVTFMAIKCRASARNILVHKNTDGSMQAKVADLELSRYMRVDSMQKPSIVV